MPSAQPPVEPTATQSTAQAGPIHEAESSGPIQAAAVGIREPEVAKPFRVVLAKELDQIRARRQRVGGAAAGGDGGGEDCSTIEAVREQAHGMDLVGLAFSGGGIRSATFALGILQGLARLELLTRFDYLSTVSGGGYIGGWL